jgi:hypothetical protein
VAIIASLAQFGSASPLLPSEPECALGLGWKCTILIGDKVTLLRITPLVHESQIGNIPNLSLGPAILLAIVLRHPVVNSRFQRTFDHIEVKFTTTVRVHTEIAVSLTASGNKFSTRNLRVLWYTL